MPTSDPITTLSIDRLTRHIRVFGKFFRRLQQLDSEKFVELPACNDMVLYYWSKVIEATNHRSGDMIQGTRKLLERVHRFQPIFLRHQIHLLPSTQSDSLSKQWSFLKKTLPGGPLSEKAVQSLRQVRTIPETSCSSLTSHLQRCHSSLSKIQSGCLSHVSFLSIHPISRAGWLILKNGLTKKTKKMNYGNMSFAYVFAFRGLRMFLTGVALWGTRPHDARGTISGLRCPINGIHVQIHDR